MIDTAILAGMPILINGLQVTVLEGEDLIVDGLEEQPAAYPFPIFQWTRNGIPVVNISESVSYGYPSINFYNISRTAAGNYSLFAENYVINSTGTSIMVGNDMGSFTLDVFCECHNNNKKNNSYIYCNIVNNVSDGPELMEPLSNTFTTLQQSSITLICGVSVVGNPFPVVQWFSNTGDEISPSDGNFSINNGPDVVSLTIVDPSQADNGTWNCVFTLFAPNGTALKQLERTVSLVVVGECITML